MSLDDQLTEGLKQFLVASGADGEAELAGQYIRHPGSVQQPVNESFAGIPGGEAALMIGAIAAPFLMRIAEWAIKELAQKAGEKLVEHAVARIAARLKGLRDAPSVVSDKVTTVREVAAALERAGVDRERAQERAEQLWLAGLTVGQRYVEAGRAGG